MNRVKTLTLSDKNLRGFNFEETKRNVNSYFTNMENLKWEWEKLNAQRGLVANYDFSLENRKQPYMQIDRDILNLSAKELTEEELKRHIAGFHWAKSVLSDIEQIYIMEYFVNRKYQDEIVDLLGFNSTDSLDFKRLKRSAVYKFADFLNLVVENK